MPNAQDSSRSVRQKYGLAAQSIKANGEVNGEVGISSGISSSKEHAILCNTLQHIVKELLDEMLAGQLCCITNEHPWLKPLLIAIEVALIHRVADIDGMWKRIVQTCADEDAVGNVCCFPGVVTAVGQLRLWILFSLTNKSLGKQLREVCKAPTVGDASILPASAFLSQNLDRLQSVWWSLEALDFSLIINEADISQDSPRIDWTELFLYDDVLNFRLFHLKLPLPSQTGPRPAPRIDELQDTLRSQISQRAYYQQQCVKLQREVVELRQQLGELLAVDPKEAIGLRVACLEERLKTSELVRGRQRLALDELKRRITLLQMHRGEDYNKEG